MAICRGKGESTQQYQENVTADTEDTEIVQKAYSTI